MHVNWPRGGSAGTAGRIPQASLGHAVSSTSSTATAAAVPRRQSSVPGVRTRRSSARVHQPVSRLERDPEALTALGHADALIAVAGEQAEQLAALELNCPVHWLPHGVWTGAFRPVPGAAQAEAAQRQSTRRELSQRLGECEPHYRAAGGRWCPNARGRVARV